MRYKDRVRKWQRCPGMTRLSEIYFLCESFQSLVRNTLEKITFYLKIRVVLSPLTHFFCHVAQVVKVLIMSTHMGENILSEKYVLFVSLFVSFYGDLESK